MKLAALTGITLLFAPVVAADPLLPLIERYEAFAEEQNPERAAQARGEAPRSWPDLSLEASAARDAEAAALLGAIRGVETSRTIDRAILIRLLENARLEQAYDLGRIPFTGDWGFQSEPVFAALRLRLRSVEEAEAWIARLNDVPRYFAENRAAMERGIATGWTAHADPLATVMEQIDAQLAGDLADSALYAPFLALPEDLPEEEAEALRAAGLEAAGRARAAYRAMQDFLTGSYAPAVRAGAGIAGLPDGRLVYSALVDHHTAGAGYSPEEIHTIGEAEVARIRAAMQAVMAETGFDGPFAEFLARLRTNPDFYAASEEDLLEAAREISGRLDAILPQLFSRLPELPYTVEPVPLAVAPGYTTGRYVLGDPKEGRPGTYLVNTWALDQRPLYELPALSAHEAVPGHHLQIALAQEMTGQPRFRRDYYATAFGEGWGLYAEYLAGEAGIYRTPYERFGALSYEMWRACRLVADTGLHWYGWSREEAEACFIENTALAPLNIRTEVTRYIGWPGQAVAYKIGEIKIRALRAEAEAALGDAFDIRAFHHAVLGEGAVPLDVLEAQVEDWVAAETPLAP